MQQTWHFDEKSLPQERHTTVNDCHALAMKIDPCNDTHADEVPLPSRFDFTDDAEAMKIASGLDEDAA